MKSHIVLIETIKWFACRIIAFHVEMFSDDNASSLIFFFRFTYSCDAATWQWKVMAIKKLNVSQEQRRNNLEREVQRLCIRLLDPPSLSLFPSLFFPSFLQTLLFPLARKRPLFFHFSPPAISTLLSHFSRTGSSNFSYRAFSPRWFYRIQNSDRLLPRGLRKRLRNRRCRNKILR